MYRKDQQDAEIALKFTMERDGSQCCFLLLSVTFWENHPELMNYGKLTTWIFFIFGQLEEKSPRIDESW